MIILGIIALIAGIASAIYGNAQNNDLEAQLKSALEDGTTNPGDTFLYIGIAVAVVGAILLIVGISKHKKG